MEFASELMTFLSAVLSLVVAVPLFKRSAKFGDSNFSVFERLFNGLFLGRVSLAPTFAIGRIV
ncbi:MAG: hypothetical protein ACOH2H_10520 [Cypionkella sp.]